MHEQLKDTFIDKIKWTHIVKDFDEVMSNFKNESKNL